MAGRLKKWWWLPVLIFAIAIIGWQEKRSESQTEKCRAQYSKELSITPVGQKAAEKQAIAAACEANSYLGGLFSATNIPTLLLVLVGICGTVAALKTLDAIEKQADVMIASERAWIMADLVPAPGSGTKVHRTISTSGDGHKRTNIALRVMARNEGKAPAWITDRRIRGEIRTTPLPLAPDLDNVSESQRHCEPQPVSVGKDSEPHWDIAVICDGHEGQGQMTVIYGVIIYRDAFSNEHTTTFGYKLTADGQLKRLEGLPEYNQNK